MLRALPCSTVIVSNGRVTDQPLAVSFYASCCLHGTRNLGSVAALIPQATHIPRHIRFIPSCSARWRTRIPGYKSAASRVAELLAPSVVTGPKGAGAGRRPLRRQPSRSFHLCRDTDSDPAWSQHSGDVALIGPRRGWLSLSQRIKRSSGRSLFKSVVRILRKAVFARYYLGIMRFRTTSSRMWPGSSLGTTRTVRTTRSPSFCRRLT